MPQYRKARLPQILLDASSSQGISIQQLGTTNFWVQQRISSAEQLYTLVTNVIQQLERQKYEFVDKKNTLFEAGHIIHSIKYPRGAPYFDPKVDISVFDPSKAFDDGNGGFDQVAGQLRLLSQELSNYRQDLTTTYTNLTGVLVNLQNLQTKMGSSLDALRHGADKEKLRREFAEQLPISMTYVAQLKEKIGAEDAGMLELLRSILDKTRKVIQDYQQYLKCWVREVQMSEEFMVGQSTDKIYVIADASYFLETARKQWLQVEESLLNLVGQTFEQHKTETDALDDTLEGAFRRLETGPGLKTQSGYAGKDLVKIV
ncbi:hypothetical protein GYMLUDRAFT_83138 [Collybiopsis luxurians FD-317 M1]|nr:hypothetical protein GYMLUDRAFT_83138 [Collybiopsis luxurians FD-317 M1]